MAFDCEKPSKGISLESAIAQSRTIDKMYSLNVHFADDTIHLKNASRSSTLTNYLSKLNHNNLSALNGTETTTIA